jgi:fumarate hydratase, class I
VGIGVSCSADRNLLGRIDRDGIWLEQLEHDPARFLPETDEETLSAQASTHRSQPANGCHPRRTLPSPNQDPPALERPDHRRPRQCPRQTQRAPRSRRGLPDYFKDHIIYYAGPAKTPEGHASGAFGPTTAGRMDSYVALFQQYGASLVMLAKGNRSHEVREACRRFGGFYLGSIGGAAAILAQQSIKKIEIIDYPELGMEAVHRIEVEDFPAFIVIDDKGHDFFAELGM